MRYDVGKLLAEITDSTVKMAVLVLGLALTAAAVEFSFHMTILRRDFSPVARGMMEAALIGAMMGAVVWVGLAAARARRRVMAREMQRVAELNHNVRNALQVIVYNEHLRGPVQASAVLDSAARIEHTIKELFPTVAIDPAQLSRKARQP